MASNPTRRWHAPTPATDLMWMSVLLLLSLPMKNQGVPCGLLVSQTTSWSHRTQSSNISLFFAGNGSADKNIGYTHIAWQSRKSQVQCCLTSLLRALPAVTTVDAKMIFPETVMARSFEPFSWPGHLQEYVQVRVTAHIGFLSSVEHSGSRKSFFNSDQKLERV